MAESATATAPKLERAIVAAGRTVRVSIPGKKVFVGRHHETGIAVEADATEDFGPNQEVELPRAEVHRLRDLGYLVDPNAKAPERAEGTSLTEHNR